MNISDLTKSISAAVDALPSGDDIKYEERRELLTATERLKTALETPVEAAFRIIFGVIYQLFSYTAYFIAFEADELPMEKLRLT